MLLAVNEFGVLRLRGLGPAVALREKALLEIWPPAETLLGVSLLQVLLRGREGEGARGRGWPQLVVTGHR